MKDVVCKWLVDPLEPNPLAQKHPIITWGAYTRLFRQMDQGGDIKLQVLASGESHQVECEWVLGGR